MTLLEMPKGSVVEICAIKGGKAVADRLRALGFFAGSKVRLVKTAPFRGPLLVEDMTTGARIMIGRGMAGKIEVCYGDPAGA